MSFVTNSNIEAPFWQGINLLSAGLQFKESTWHQRSEEKHSVSLVQCFSKQQLRNYKTCKRGFAKLSLLLWACLLSPPHPHTALPNVPLTGCEKNILCILDTCLFKEIEEAFLCLSIICHIFFTVFTMFTNVLRRFFTGISGLWILQSVIQNVSYLIVQKQLK